MENLCEIILTILIKFKVKRYEWQRIRNQIDTRYECESLESTIKEESI